MCAWHHARALDGWHGCWRDRPRRRRHPARAWKKGCGTPGWPVSVSCRCGSCGGRRCRRGASRQLARQGCQERPQQASANRPQLGRQRGTTHAWEPEMSPSRACAVNTGLLLRMYEQVAGSGWPAGAPPPPARREPQARIRLALELCALARSCCVSPGAVGNEWGPSWPGRSPGERLAGWRGAIQVCVSLQSRGKARQRACLPARQAQGARRLNPGPPAAACSAESRPPLPPFTEETAWAKVQAAEDAWNSR